ncbi:hypothetical protein AWC38_SpisGene16519 [Stylophora pistillata]|uniref:Uncharacterized protein n=1 Tax=Stylophora pistillata TaxID=50429 RepID=A0A2B4RN93_STYPI|nr:hypothetical protein AWC38_SpisGene16519 [Stylophora pistillata]
MIDRHPTDCNADLCHFRAGPQWDFSSTKSTRAVESMFYDYGAQQESHATANHCGNKSSKIHQSLLLRTNQCIMLFEISVLMETPEAPKGSKKHADDVIDVAKDFLSELPENNMFKPQVLVSVSCNGRWSVGSSVAGSYFITPLCLCRQIYDFKPCLKKAIISFKPVENVAANYNWSSSAVCGKDYKTRKAPCKNCKVIFKNLNGFLSTNDDSVQERSTLAACAEYGSVNSLLSDGGEVLTESEQNFLELKWKQCIIFFEQFGRVVDGIIKAYNSNDDEEQRNVFEQEKHILVIFNLKSESMTET